MRYTLVRVKVVKRAAGLLTRLAVTKEITKQSIFFFFKKLRAFIIFVLIRMKIKRFSRSILLLQISEIWFH